MPINERNEPTLSETIELFEQTPIDVWREYLSNGITLQKAILEEFSYNNPERKSNAKE